MFLNSSTQSAAHADSLTAGRDLMTADRIAYAGDLVPTQPATGPRQLPGSILITRNSSRRDDSAVRLVPPAAERAAIRLAEHLVHALLANPIPATLTGQAGTFAETTGRIIKDHTKTGLDRRGVTFAEAAARNVIWYGQPTDLKFIHAGTLRRWYYDATDHEDVEPLEADDTETLENGRRLFSRPRIIWAHPDGPRHGLLLDRLHATRHTGAIGRDTWVREHVAHDLTNAAAFLAAGHTPAPDALLGVRVHAHRRVNTGVHFLPDFSHGPLRPIIGAHHPIGECDHCETQTVLPNTSPNTSVSEEVAS